MRKLGILAFLGALVAFLAAGGLLYSLGSAEAATSTANTASMTLRAKDKQGHVAVATTADPLNVVTKQQFTVFVDLDNFLIKDKNNNQQGGWIAFQSRVSWTGGLMYKPAASAEDEVLWADATPPVARGLQKVPADVHDAGSVLHGAATLLDESKAIGHLVALQFQCEEVAIGATPKTNTITLEGSTLNAAGQFVGQPGTFLTAETPPPEANPTGLQLIFPSGAKHTLPTGPPWKYYRSCRASALPQSGRIRQGEFGMNRQTGGAAATR